MFQLNPQLIKKSPLNQSKSTPQTTPNLD